MRWVIAFLAEGEGEREKRDAFLAVQFANTAQSRKEEEMRGKEPQKGRRERKGRGDEKREKNITRGRGRNAGTQGCSLVMKK